MTVMTKPAQRLRRRRRVRAKVHGTAERPRISVFRSNRGLFVQLIDDDAGRTLAAVNWTESDLRTLKPMEQAARAGALLAERARAAGVERAKKNLARVPKHGSTITHPTLGVFGAGRVLLKPASPGTGVIAGGGVRAVLELAGIHDILSKSLGSQNPINLVKATMAGLESLRTPDEVAEIRGLSVNQVLGLTTEPASGAPGASEVEGNGGAAATRGAPDAGSAAADEPVEAPQ